MNYVYDIMLNWHKKYLDFFEWEATDKIVSVHKIPILKVRNTDFKNIMMSTICIDKEFINKIKNKNSYVCLFMSDDQLLAVKFNVDGISTEKSSLMVDEELDIIENYYHLEPIKIKYEIQSKEPLLFMTKNELQRIKYLNTNIDALDIDKDQNKIRYLYYECFGILEKDSLIALNKIKKCFSNHLNIDQLYCFFKLIEQKQ